MDIPLSSTALDLALHPSPDNDLLVVGLISGKVELLNLSEQSGDGETIGKKQRLKKKQKRIQEPDDEDDEDDAESSADGSRSYAKKWSTRYKSKSCRGVEFNWDGSQIWCLSKDKTLYSLDTSTGQVSSTYADAHSAAPSRLLPLPGQTDPHLLVTGDDDGVVKLWDTRLRAAKGSSSGAEGSSSSVKAVREYSHHFDWITDLHFSRHLIPPKMSKADREKKLKEQKEREEKKRKRKLKSQQNRGRATQDGSSDEEEDDTAIQRQSGRERLICTSGDGTLSVIDFRAGSSSSSSSSTEPKKKRDLHQALGVEVSEDQEDELLSLTSVKNGSKLIVGTQLGLLSLWSPNKGMLDHIDRIPGHPSSIDCLLNLDEDTVLTGSSDGLIRVVQILPHKFLGVVADHGQGLPVERMKRKGGMLVSCGHGSEVKVTDISSLLEDGDDSDDEDGEDNDEDAEAMARRLGGAEGDSDDSDEDDVKNIGDISGPLRSGEENDDDDEEADSDDDSSEEEEEVPPPRPLTKKEKRKLQTLSAGGEDKVTHDREDFFADL